MKAYGHEQVDALLWSDKDILRIVDDEVTSKKAGYRCEKGKVMPQSAEDAVAAVEQRRIDALTLQRHLIHSQMCLYARVRSLLDLVSLRVLSAGRGPHVLRLLRCWNFWW